MRIAVCIATLGLLTLAVSGGCTSSTTPTFVLAWSEYPSWSVFGVAHEKNLIDKAEGKMGSVEKKWGVDIVLREATYEACIEMYGTGAADAACLTNMDTLSPSLGRAAVAILPTSTSVGGDACIVVGVDDVKALRQHKVYGLQGSVSEYCFARNLEILGEKEADHQFTNQDPAVAAQAMSTSQETHRAIIVWNPFVMNVLKIRKDAKILFDSSTIPEEIIDMVVMSKASLERPGGKAFASAVADAFYTISNMIEDPATRDDTLVALGAKFSNLNAQEMAEVVKKTRFYKTPQEALALFGGEALPKTMTRVVDFCAKHGIIDKAPTVGYGAAAPDAQLRFDGSWIKEYVNKGS